MTDNKKTSSQDIKKILPGIIIVAIILVGASFYGGMKYAGSKNTATNNFAGDNVLQRFGQGGTGGNNAIRRMGGQNGGVVNGDFLSKDDKSVTVKLRDGGSKIVFFTAATKVMKSISGTIDDIKEGEGLMILGTANPDGSVNAESIQVRPVFATSTFSGRP